MRERAGQPGAWSGQRWLVLVVLTLAAQVFVVFWLGAWSGMETHAASGHQPRIYLPKDQTMSLPGVDNPTLFVLPSRSGFSGPAWLRVPPVRYESAVWEDERRPTLQPIGQPGVALMGYVASNYSRPFEVVDPPEPRWALAGYYPDLTTNQSTVTVEGDLAGRKLLAELKPAAWPALDILADTTVQISVDADGLVFDAVVLRPVSGSAEADASALALARSARFEPTRRGAVELDHAEPEKLTWGRLVFHWVTTAVPATNAPARGRAP